MNYYQLYDQIKIEDLKIFAYHGVFEQENRNGQNFYINAVLYLDMELANDSLECSVDYGAVCELIRKTMTEHVYQLIETVAQKIAEAILLQYPLVDSVEIEVRKPDAPVAMDFRSISVRIQRSWHKAVIAMGSNLGDSRAYLQDAVQKLQNHSHIRNLKQSGWILTKPYGYTQQPDFLNGAVILETLYSPFQLLKFIQEIENQAGRTREIHWGARTLDLDLIFYDDRILNQSELIVPHPDLQNRDFVLKPVAEIAPYYFHPVLRKTICQLLEDLETRKNHKS
ncbi:MAG: 2-amino-4-hydroxy-6-hydroxymethyldihydropteridine diphosphokinase [Oscillospiraceae bacterium]|nr:2-amino-4-hydroxy-6-hydroxymethyldihydropteridine diphosphokinase [Oscillospiraceae bacterium]